MADCGASGSTIDRATRAVGRSESAKHVASWLGNIIVNNGSHARSGEALPMPIMSPDHLVEPILSRGSIVYSDTALSVIPSPPFDHSSQSRNHDQKSLDLLIHQQEVERVSPRNTMHHQFLHQEQIHQQQHQLQQYHYRFMLAQQQQQQQQQQKMIMLQQQQIFFCLQHQKATAHLQQQQQHIESVKSSAKDDEYIQNTQNLDGEGFQGHEGITRCAGIEELATAWAEAHEEYEQLEEAINLAAGTDFDGQTLVYEFVNKIEEQTVVADVQNWIDEGKSQFAAGNLSSAIRAFEMELQIHDADNAVAWRMLGRCYAENDQDPTAIICLEQAIDRDPYSPEARLALGVSHVNELNHFAALENLKAWITHNPKFEGFVHENHSDLYGAVPENKSTSAESTFDEVQRLLLDALSLEADSDVLEALGVVYNVSRDYKAAIASFEKAIALQTDNYQLYNRLGATLANYNQSEKALLMYQKALELRPRFTRAWLNRAISHSNLQQYEEAARCYLQTLSLNPAATHCWSYLRIALSCSEQWDLIPAAAAMDLQAFVDHYDFVFYQNS